MTARANGRVVAMEGVMSQTVMAYLLGPVVMVMLGVVLWLLSHRRHADQRGDHIERWLDAHHIDWLRHRH
jgi:hypothetical protein